MRVCSVAIESGNYKLSRTTTRTIVAHVMRCEPLGLVASEHAASEQLSLCLVCWDCKQQSETGG